MKKPEPASVIVTFVSAILSLLLPASAMSAEEGMRPHREPAPFQRRTDDRARADTIRNDPILNYPWGPGNPNLTVPKFHFRHGVTLNGSTPDGGPVPPPMTRDEPRPDHR
jgi:hypothetical protein